MGASRASATSARTSRHRHTTAAARDGRRSDRVAPVRAEDAGPRRAADRFGQHVDPRHQHAARPPRQRVAMDLGRGRKHDADPGKSGEAQALPSQKRIGRRRVDEARHQRVADRPRAERSGLPHPPVRLAPGLGPACRRSDLGRAGRQEEVAAGAGRAGQRVDGVPDRGAPGFEAWPSCATTWSRGAPRATIIFAISRSRGSSAVVEEGTHTRVEDPS